MMDKISKIYTLCIKLAFICKFMYNNFGFCFIKGECNMGIYIALGVIAIVAIIIGIVLSKAKENQLWYILSIIGTAVLTVMIVFSINFAITSNSSVASPALENTGWREQKSYSRDYQLNDDMSICVSELEDSTGYAVYDTYNGERIGTLSWPSDQISVSNLELKIVDADGDGNNDVGVVTQNSDIIWFKFSPDKQYNKDNPNGCFELIK